MPAPLRNRDALMDTAKALFVQGVPIPRIHEQLGLNKNTLAKWAARYKWAQTRDKMADWRGKAVAKVVGDSIEAQSHNVRSKLANSLERAASVMSVAKITANNLATNRGRQGQAAVLKTLAEGAEKVFGWDNSSKGTLTLAMFVTTQSADPIPITEGNRQGEIEGDKSVSCQANSIEVESVVTPQESKESAL